MSLRLVAFVALCAYIQNAAAQTFNGNSLQCTARKLKVLSINFRNNTLCNGVQDCADGSGESPSRCDKTSTERPSTKRPSTERPPTFDEDMCPLPQQPQNGRYTRQCPDQGGCDVSPGRSAVKPGDSLLYTCDAGYKLNTGQSVFCSSVGTWSVIPSCEVVTCPALASASRMAGCTQSNSDWISCETSRVPRGTSARLACRNSYVRDTSDLWTRDRVKCNADGQWEPRPINCVPVCGIATTGTGTPLIVNGSLATVSDFPWHGTLYRQKNVEKQFICGATIISDNMLVTAAHCVYDEANRKIDDPNKYYVAVGNIFRDYDDESNNPLTYSSARVERIYAQSIYMGLTGNYAFDIAILVIDKPFVFSALLMPICLDTSGVTDQAALEVGNYGRVAGFGRTATGDSSFILQAITVPYVSQTACKAESAQSESDRFITSDKFCAGYTNGTSVCDGDSGGGLVFETDRKWYLRGIVSVGIGATKVGAVRTCDSHTYSLYTRVARHMDWLLNVISEESYKNTH